MSLLSVALSAAAAAGHGAAESEHGPTLLGLNSEHWVWVGITIFLLLALTVFKLPRRIVEALDARIAHARQELDRAFEIRQEAEALLLEAQTRHAASASDAAAIVAHAQQEAEALIAKAEADAAELTARRAKMARDKIAAAERAAIAEVRAAAADAAASAAAAIIAEKHGAAADKPLVDKTIAGLARAN